MNNTLDVLFHNDETTIDEREVTEQTFKMALLFMFEQFTNFYESDAAKELHGEIVDAMTQTDGVVGFSWLAAFEAAEVGWVQS